MSVPLGLGTFSLAAWLMTLPPPVVEPSGVVDDSRVERDARTSGTSTPEREVPAPRVSETFVTRAPAEGPAMLDPEQRTQMEATSLGLRSLPDGSYVYVGTAGERFDALIREDGTVRLLPESPVQIKANSVCAVVVCVHPEGKASGRRGNQVERWSLLAGAAAAVLAASALETDPRDPVTDPIDARQPERAWTQTPPGLSATPASVVAPSSPVPLGGASLRYGYLPSPNRQMMAFLERTFEFRLRLAVEAFQRRCEYAVHNLPLRLLVLASREDLRPRELRQEILHLWDELEVRSVDTPLRDAAAAEVAAARDHAVVSARQEIVDFVRDRLPRGSGLAFTRGELRRFNAGRKTDAMFWPYARGSAGAR